MKPICAIGVASGMGGPSNGCRLAPNTLKNSLYFSRILKHFKVNLKWDGIIEPHPRVSGVESSRELFKRLAIWSRKTVQDGTPFIALGGDHSLAMGLWKGVMRGLEPGERLGLIWIDAHLDAHTFTTSPTHSLHGMPLAGLLGKGDPLLQCIYGNGPHLQPEHLALVGTRSYAKSEWKLMNGLKVPCFDMQSIKKEGSLERVLSKAIAHVGRKADRLGVSIDLDAVEPEDAPGVQMPEAGGLKRQELAAALSLLNGDSRLVGMEIAEFDPLLDRDHRTVRLIAELIGSLYSPESEEHRALVSSSEDISLGSTPMPSSELRR